MKREDKIAYRPDAPDATGVWQLPLNTRACNVAVAAGRGSLGELLAWRREPAWEEDFLSYPNAGQASLAQLKDLLDRIEEDRRQAVPA